MAERRFEISSAEGLPIRGVAEIPSEPRGVVVIVHGFKGFKEWGFFPWVAARFAAAGIASVRFDMSRSGIGERPGEFDRLDLFGDDTYGRELDDLASVLSWVAHLREVGDLPLFLMGHSRGGGVSILGAKKVASPLVRGIVTWSGVARADRWPDAVKREWRKRGVLEVQNARTGQTMPISTAVLDDLEARGKDLDILAALDETECPLLIVHGTADETVPPEEAEELARRARNGSLVLIENGTHTFGAKHPFDGVPKPLSFAMHATLGFVNAYCRAARMVARVRQG
ncbi:MAG TPA: alpha/beta fold hydrolase [Thermoanaerobaculia bacterium]|nr:alpha/beta fold hydrolase [Thermoanaerobaculia bacterium]